MSGVLPPAPRLGAIAVMAVLALVVAACSAGEDPDTPAAAEAAAASPAGPDCGPVLREPTGGAGSHVDGAPIIYPAAPPSFGDHRSRWEVRARSFYGVDDRPEVSVLVHNLEHGYNILWYDQSIVDDAEELARLREIADSYASLGRGRDPATAFIAAPWTEADGGAFPDGMHYAFTHWYADPTDRTRSRADEVGLTRFCSGIDAAVVQEWMDDYPLADAPEGFPDLM